MKGEEMKQDNYEKIVKYIIKNQEKFYRLAYTYARNQEDALDIVQNSICKGLENYKSIRDINAIKTWFYRIIVNESINFLNKYKKEIIINETIKEKAYYEPQYAEEGFFGEINKLPFEIQNIIKLRFYEDMTLNEIAEITELNVSTVKTKLYRGLKLLKQEIKEVTL